MIDSQCQGDPNPMKLVKILNNNVAVALDHDGTEVVVMGNGLVFQKKPGDIIDPAKIDKVFKLADKSFTQHFEELFRNIPADFFKVCMQIIELAEGKLGKLDQRLYITLTDHCYFALERQRNGHVIRNAILWDIKRLYPKEFAISLMACNIINEKFSAVFNEDEAGFIALHFVTAQLNSNMPDVMKTTKIMQEILQLVKYQLAINYDESSLSYQRFITHLKFFIHRLLANENIEIGDSALSESIRIALPKYWKCADMVATYLQSTHNYIANEDEKMFLSIHIERVSRTHSRT